MKIMVLSPVFPYPPFDGDKLRIYNEIKQMSKKHEIYLLAFMRRGEEKHLPEIKKYCEHVGVFRIGALKMAVNVAARFFNPLPLNAAAYGSKEFEQAASRLAARHNPDVVFAYRLRMAQFAVHIDAPRVIDMVDSLAVHAKRALKTESNLPRRVYYALDAARLEEYEKKAATEFSTVFFNSEDEAGLLGIKNGVTLLNGPVEFKKGPALKKPPVFTVGFFGGMDYPPNMDAVDFFYKNVWKKRFISDKNIKFVIAGKNSEKLKGFSAGGNVEVRGLVPDIDAELKSWDLCVVPVRYGTGKQNKIIQAWANSVPVLATRYAAAGVYGKNNQNIFTAETAQEFAESIARLMKNKKRLAAIARQGKAAQKRYFDWDKSGKIIEKALEKARRKK